MGEVFDFAKIQVMISNVISVVDSVFDAITSNPLLILFVSASVLTMGIGIFKRLKRAAH